MSKQLLSIIVSTILILFIAVTSYLTYDLSIKYDKEKHEIAQSSKIENKMDSYFKSINDYLSNFTLKKDEKVELSTTKDDMHFFLILYFIGLVVLALTFFFSSKDIFIFSTITVSLISWLVGILAPIMTIEVFKDLPVFGFTIFKYESKSILTTVENLWQLENYFISILVMLFSMIIPIIKTIALYFSVMMKSSVKYIDFIGKWAMADVFIVALLLTNLSLNADEFTNAQVQVAIYFFSSYVVLSIFASYLLNKRLSFNLLK